MIISNLRIDDQLSVKTINYLLCIFITSINIQICTLNVVNFVNSSVC